MQTYSPSIRLYVNFPLKKEVNFSVQDKQAHYLSNVMRLKIGRKFLVFNGVDGEFEAEIINKLNNEIKFKLTRKTREQSEEPRLNLIFSTSFLPFPENNSHSITGLLETSSNKRINNRDGFHE